ncbi:MAG: hypothetical protein ACM3SQ_08985 [Betaproteobacteria bacterium]
MTPREIEEYRELRATIRERGTTRVWVFVAGLVSWAGLAVATLALATLPVATLLPLLVLAGIFEAVFSLHVAVERIGRYVQVFLEPEPGWEHAAMALGRPAVRTDPLFAAAFLGAAVINFIPVLIVQPTQIELAFTGAFHLAFVGRVLVGRRRAAHQRADDLERFQRMKKA